MSKRKRFAGDASVCATARGECACHTMRRRSSEICTRRSCVAALALVGPFASPAALRASVRRSHVSRGDGVASSFIVIRMPSSHAVSPPQSRSASRRRADRHASGTKLSAAAVPFPPPLSPAAATGST